MPSVSRLEAKPQVMEWGSEEMRNRTLVILMLLWTMMAQGQTCTDSVQARFFRDFYHQGHLVHWIDGLSDHTVYQGLHLGQWDESGQLMFSVDGNSYRWNRFYFDGFRVDNRFTPGSTSYVPNMEQYDLRLDSRTSELAFQLDTTASDYASLSYNRGGLGGINPTTEGIVHLFHNTGSEGAYDPSTIHRRQYARGQGTADVAYTLRSKAGRAYRQHLYASVGEQMYPNYNHEGLLPGASLYPADYYKVQMDGHLPSGRLERLGYLVNFSGRENYGAEFYMNPNEVARLNTYSASLYARHLGLTTGLTWATNRVRHSDLTFSRNVVDQDGESLEPWMPDGQTHEFSWALAYKRTLLRWLSFEADAYNSLLHFSPSQERFGNEVFMQHIGQAQPMPLYHYDWTSHSFTGGLLENRVGLVARHSVSPKFSVQGQLHLTLDGMVLKDKTKVTPNVRALLQLDYQPVRWLSLGLSLAHESVSYNIEDLRYMSNDHLNGELRYAATGELLTTTGGRHHHYAEKLWQPAYIGLDVPIRLTFGRHEIALLQTYRKYYHTWMTTFVGGIDANGKTDSEGYYFLNPGMREYEVGYQPTALMGGGFFTNTPYYMSQTSRYTYRGRKVMFSLSWQSMMGVGLSALGNGPAANNIGVLSESTANPNSHTVLENADGKHPAVGRLDQDKAYVLRIYLAYNVNRHFQFGITGRWTDGQPFSYFNTATETDASGNTQVAIRPGCTRGINPTDGNFGCRESALFNIDLHARAQWTLGGHDMSLSLLCYNIYDFGNVYNEMCFPQGLRGLQSRGPNFTLTIPRGILTTLKIDL